MHVLWSRKTAAPPRGLSLARERGCFLVWDADHNLQLFNRSGEPQARRRDSQVARRQSVESILMEMRLGRDRTLYSSHDSVKTGALYHSFAVWPQVYGEVPGRSIGN